VVLVRLNHEGPTTPTELAGREGVTSQAIAAAVRSLEAKGLVSRSADPHDGRRTVLALTDAGMSVLRDRETTVMNGFVRALEDSFSAAERRRLYDVIPLLNRLADNI
jgi:DNA-binding MarR family transcriptional regulator